MGVRRLDVLALTHGDPDHIGGATSLVREFRPREVWEGIPVPPFEPLRALRQEAAAVGARWSNLRRGDRTWIDDVEVIVRHPDRAGLGAAAGAERRLDRARSAVARRLRAADR